VKIMVEADLRALENGTQSEIDWPDLPGWRPASGVKRSPGSA